MARSSSTDPIEKFRFQVLFLEDSGSILGNAQTTSININQNNSNRAGFSEASLPAATVNSITYRENLNGNRPIQHPGIASYEPVVLRRGVTSNNELYQWYKLVNDDAGSLNRFSDAIAGLGAIPFNEPRFRKDVLISSIDRTGKFVKHWFISNAWPSSYKGGDDFDSSLDAILLEEMTLTYESFVEVKGATIDEALRDVQNQANDSTRRQAAAGAISTILGQ